MNDFPDYYRFSYSRAIELGPLRLSILQVGPDYDPVAKYIAFEWRHGAGFPDGWTGAVRLEKLRYDSPNYWAPFFVKPRTTWKGIQKQIWSGAHD